MGRWTVTLASVVLLLSQNALAGPPAGAGAQRTARTGGSEHGRAEATRAASSVASRCFGTRANGRLERGVQLPVEGPNFRAYGALPHALGRTYVHSQVASVVLDAYRDLARRRPTNRFVYGETGWASGGSFAPHRTHQNGLSVDFMVPVLDAKGGSVPAPTRITERYGYDLAFDRHGRGAAGQIDFESVAAHIAALARAARKNKTPIRKVIFAPDLQRKLRKTSSWKEIRKLPWSRRPVWVRHDDHFHVDFRVRCAPLSAARDG